MSPYRERYRRDLNDLKTLTKDLADRVGEAIKKSVLALAMEMSIWPERWSKRIRRWMI